MRMNKGGHAAAVLFIIYEFEGLLLLTLKHDGYRWLAPSFTRKAEPPSLLHEKGFKKSRSFLLSLWLWSVFIGDACAHPWGGLG